MIKPLSDLPPGGWVNLWIAQDPADALAILAELGGKGVWVYVEQPFATVAEAERFIADVARFR